MFGFLLMCEMEEEGLGFLGFLFIDYVLLIWLLDLVLDFVFLLDVVWLWVGLGDWLGENVVMKCIFCNVVVVVGLI